MPLFGQKNDQNQLKSIFTAITYHTGPFGGHLDEKIPNPPLTPQNGPLYDPNYATCHTKNRNFEFCKPKNQGYPSTDFILCHLIPQEPVYNLVQFCINGILCHII